MLLDQTIENCVSRKIGQCILLKCNRLHSCTHIRLEFNADIVGGFNLIYVLWPGFNVLKYVCTMVSLNTIIAKDVRIRIDENYRKFCVIFNKLFKFLIYENLFCFFFVNHRISKNNFQFV